MTRRFRRHRGSLAESMETVITVASRAALIEHLKIGWHQVDYSQLVIEPYMLSPDDRIGWPETWIVLSCPGGAPLGFTDGPLE